MGETPPDFIILAGSREKLGKAAEALSLSKDELKIAPSLSDLLNGKNGIALPGGTRSEAETYDEYPSLNGTAKDEIELAAFLATRSDAISDVRFSVDATAGVNVYDVFNLLSEISGISIIVDPYAFQAPVGGTRPPLQGAPPATQPSGGGFRGADEYSPVRLGTGGAAAVYGKFVNAPFDVVFETIIASNNLDYTLIPNADDPYAKPVIFVSSRERMEHELNIAGVSSIGEYQIHYADPLQLQQILINMNILPSTNTGFFIYRGGQIGGSGGGQGSGSGGAGGTGGGGQGGGGGTGAGGGYGAGIPLPTAKGGLMIIRGTSADQAGFYNRLLSRESKVRDGRLFFMRIALSPGALENELPPGEMNSYLVML